MNIILCALLQLCFLLLVTPAITNTPGQSTNQERPVESVIPPSVSTNWTISERKGPQSPQSIVFDQECNKGYGRDSNGNCVKEFI